MINDICAEKAIKFLTERETLLLTSREKLVGQRDGWQNVAVVLQGVRKSSLVQSEIGLIIVDEIDDIVLQVDREIGIIRESLKLLQQPPVSNVVNPVIASDAHVAA